MSTRERVATARATRTTSGRTMDSDVACSATRCDWVRVRSTSSGGSSGPNALPMSTRHVSSARRRPASAATPTRKGTYPAYPMSRQNRVTVAGEVPARAASSVIDISSGARGSSRSSVASLAIVPDIRETLAWMRLCTPTGAGLGAGVGGGWAAVSVVTGENPSQAQEGWLKSILTGRGAPWVAVR